MSNRSDASSKRLILVGNPNAGKSTLFNALTGGHAKVGNWHGVTVRATEGKCKLRGETVTVCDVPGVYSLDGMSMEEKYARDYIESDPQAVLLFVAECANLPRALPLFQALAKDRQAVLILTKRKRFIKSGGTVDDSRLSQELNLPVISAEGKSKTALKRELVQALQVPSCHMRTCALTHYSYNAPSGGLSRFDRLLLSGFFGIPFFFALLCLTFYITFAPGHLGDLCKSGVESLFSDVLAGYADRISAPVLRSFLADGVLRSLGSVLCFLPQISLLYLFLILMEESGFLSRLAYLTDGFFSKIGLNGRAVFSLLMGFGCTAAAILTTRGLDDKRVQRRVILCLPYISCSAKLPVFLALSASFFTNPFYGVVILYAVGVAIALLAAYLMRDKTPPLFLMELAPLQTPSPIFVCKSLLFQIKQFIMKTATVILAFFVFSWLMSSFDFSFRLCSVEESMLAVICGGLRYLFAPVGMNDWRIAYAALSGLVAKENVAGMIAVFFGEFPFSAASAFALAVFVLTCSPCVSAIAATAHETGWKRALLYAAGQTLSALLMSYIAYFTLMGGVIYLAVALSPVAAILIYRNRKLETVHRKRRLFAKKLHR